MVHNMVHGMAHGLVWCMAWCMDCYGAWYGALIGMVHGMVHGLVRCMVYMVHGLLVLWLVIVRCFYTKRSRDKVAFAATIARLSVCHAIVA